MSEEKKPNPSTNIPLLSYRKSEQNIKTRSMIKQLEHKTAVRIL